MTTPRAADLISSEPDDRFDGRCRTDQTYHDRLRADHALFRAEGIPLGVQTLEPDEDPLHLALCPGCGTTVAQAVPSNRKITDADFDTARAHAAVKLLQDAGRNPKMYLHHMLVENLPVTLYVVVADR